MARAEKIRPLTLAGRLVCFYHRISQSTWVKVARMENTTSTLACQCILINNSSSHTFQYQQFPRFDSEPFCFNNLTRSTVCEASNLKSAQYVHLSMSKKQNISLSRGDGSSTQSNVSFSPTGMFPSLYRKYGSFFQSEILRQFSDWPFSLFST